MLSHVCGSSYLSPVRLLRSRQDCLSRLSGAYRCARSSILPPELSIQDGLPARKQKYPILSPDRSPERDRPFPVVPATGIHANKEAGSETSWPMSFRDNVPRREGKRIPPRSAPYRDPRLPTPTGTRLPSSPGQRQQPVHTDQSRHSNLH